MAAQGAVRPDFARSLYDQNVMREMQMNLLRLVAKGQSIHSKMIIERQILV